MPVSKPGLEPKLFKAAAAGDAAAVEQLLRAGAFVNAKDPVRGRHRSPPCWHPHPD